MTFRGNEVDLIVSCVSFSAITDERRGAPLQRGFLDGEGSTAGIDEGGVTLGGREAEEAADEPDHGGVGITAERKSLGVLSKRVDNELGSIIRHERRPLRGFMSEVAQRIVFSPAEVDSASSAAFHCGTLSGETEPQGGKLGAFGRSLLRQVSEESFPSIDLFLTLQGAQQFGGAAVIDQW